MSLDNDLEGRRDEHHSPRQGSSTAGMELLNHESAFMLALWIPERIIEQRKRNSLIGIEEHYGLVKLCRYF